MYLSTSTTDWNDFCRNHRRMSWTYSGCAVPNKATGRRLSDAETLENSGEDDLMLMNTPQGKQRASRHPAARALQEQVDGDGAPKEAHVVDKMLFSPGKGEEHKGDSDVDHVTSSTSSKKQQGSADHENIVQLVQVLKYSQSDWNKMKQELELDYNARILNKEREWSKKLADRDKKISHLEEQALLLRSANEDMRCVVAEFEKTISQLQAEKEKTTSESQQGFEDVVKERDQALEDLQSVETAFSDLHQRYERTKGVVEGFKKNEDVLKKCVQDYQGKLKAAEEKAVSVRQQAEEKLDQANLEIEKVRKVTTAEVARLEAALKKSELKISGLERSLDQKVKENDELTAICDELIAKVGGD